MFSFIKNFSPKCCNKHPKGFTELDRNGYYYTIWFKMLLRRFNTVSNYSKVFLPES